MLENLSKAQLNSMSAVAHPAKIPVLFCGVGSDLAGINHYRTLVPSRALGAGALVQDAGGNVWHAERTMTLDPEVVVMQMPVFKYQEEQIKRARAEGRTVYANVDDYIPSLQRQFERGAHSHGNAFTPEVMKRHARCLSLCDGILCSTPWLMKKYSSVNEVKLFMNGLDLDRYRMEPVIKDKVIVGWAGGTGHVRALEKIVNPISTVMKWHPDAALVIQGDRDGYNLFDGKVPEVAHFRWSDLHIYPRDTACFSVGLAPGEENNFFRAKSQLRFYEQAALGIALVAHPMYDEINHGVDGFIAKDEHDWITYVDLLVGEPDVAKRIGDAAKERAFSEFGAEHRVPHWMESLGQKVLGG